MSTIPVKLPYMEKIKLISRDARFTIVAWMFWAYAFGINDVIFNLYLLEAGFGEDFLGFFLSISMFLAGGLGIIAGMVADRHSRKRILLIGNSMVFIAFIIQYSTLNPAYLLISQILYGSGFMFSGVCWQPYTAHVTTEEERVHVFSVRYALFLVASLLGSLTGGFLPAIWSNLGFTIDLFTAYRYSLWLALIPLALGVLTIIPMSVDRPLDNGLIKFGLGNIKNRGFIGKYAFAWTVSGFGAGLFVQFFNVFFNRAFGADSITIGVIFALNTMFMALGNFVSPAIVDRFGKMASIIWFQALSVPFLMVLAWSPTLSIAIVGFISRAMFMNIAWPVMDVYYMEGLDKDERSTAMGVINSGDALARAIGLNVGGVMLAAGWLRLPFAIAAIFYGLSVVMFYWFFARETTKREPPSQPTETSELTPQ